MRGVILAAGSGSRMGEATDDVPKAFIEVDGRTLTAALFTFAGWQMVSGPTAAAPQATAVGTRTVANGSVVVTVELQNRQDIGLVSATIEADCDTPPPEVAFEYVPADSIRRGKLVCPPGSGTPTVSVSRWVNA